MILAFVNPYSPENDAGVISVLCNHFLDIFHSLIDPSFVADMLPAWDFCKDQQPDTVTLVKEMMALGVVGSTHRVAAQLFLQNARVLPL